MSPLAPSVASYPTTLRAVAAYGLPGTLLDLPAAPLTERAFTELHARVRAQKLTGLFWAAISEGAFPATARQAELAEDWHVRILANNLLLEELLVDMVGALGEADIPVRALKGSATAHLDYDNPAHRTFGDIDLLVPGSAFDEAVAVLEARGCQRKFPEPRPGFTREFGKGVALRLGDQFEVDLHRTFTMGPYGLSLALDEVWKDHDSFSLAGVSVLALSTEARLLHATYHATLGDRRPRLAPLRDTAQILLMRQVSWARLKELMRASRGEAVVARGIAMAWRELNLADVLAGSAWAEAYYEDKHETSDIAVYGNNSSEATRSLAALRAIPSVTRKVRFLTALALPERSYLDGRHAGHVDRMRRGIADLRRWQSAQ